MKPEADLMPSSFPTVWSELLQNERSKAVNEERKRFSNELHDVVATHLNGTTLLLAAARQLLPPGEVKDLIDSAEQCVRDCWNDARRSAENLRPAELVRSGLVRVLSEFANHLSAASSASVTFGFSGIPTPLSEDTKLAILRVTQEAATNAIRHANPNSVSISLAFGSDDIAMTVSDDGDGFDAASADVGIGLRSMRDRARRIGGELMVLSNQGHGTQVILTAPTVATCLPESERFIG